MSTVTPIVDHVDDLWPADGAARTTRSTSSCCASHLLGANRAVVELRRRQHVGQGHGRRPRRPRARR